MISLLTFLTLILVAGADRDETRRGGEYGGAKLEGTSLKAENTGGKSVTENPQSSEHLGSYGKNFRQGRGVIYEPRQDNKRVIDGGVDVLIGGTAIRRRPVEEKTGGEDGNIRDFRGRQYGGGDDSGYKTGGGVGVLNGGPIDGEHPVKSASEEGRGFLGGRNRGNGGSVYRGNYGRGQGRGYGVRYEDKDDVFNIGGGVGVLIGGPAIGEGPDKNNNGEHRGIIHGRKSGNDDEDYRVSYEESPARSYGVRFEDDNIDGRVGAFSPESTTYERADKGTDEERRGNRGGLDKGTRVRYEDDQSVYNIGGRVHAFIPGSTTYRRSDKGIDLKQRDDVDGRGKGNEGRLYGGGGYRSDYGGHSNRRYDLKNAGRENVYNVQGRAGVFIPETPINVREKDTGERRHGDEVSTLSGRNAGGQSGEDGYTGSSTGDLDKGYGVRYVGRHGTYNIQGGVDRFIPERANYGGRVKFTN